MITTMSDAASNSDDVANSVVTMDVLKEFANQIGMQMKATIDPVMTEVNKINAEFTRRMNATDEALNGVINFLNQNKQQTSQSDNKEMIGRLITEFKPVIMERLGMAPQPIVDPDLQRSLERNLMLLQHKSVKLANDALVSLLKKDINVRAITKSVANDLVQDHMPNV